MIACQISSIKLCPINFKSFNCVNKLIGNIEATLLFAKLKFHYLHTKLTKNGQKVIVRSREQIAKWFSYSTKKVDRLLAYLENKGLITKQVGLWYGKKRIYLTLQPTDETVPINVKLLDKIIEKTGAVKAALVFSKIAFSYASSKISHEGKKWCSIKKEELSSWAGISVRTLDSILLNLVNNGLILKKNFSWKNKTQSHYHIPEFVIELLLSNVNNKENDFIHRQNCRQLPAKMSKSIKISTKEEKTNNNTREPSLSTANSTAKSDIIFEKIGEGLSKRQLKYLESAIQRTIERNKLRVSNPRELFEEIKFSILDENQRKGIASFRHAVYRCMRILADGNWRTPIGFYKYCQKGAQIREKRLQNEKEWEKKKRQDYVSIGANPLKTIGNQNQQLTEKALQFAKELVKISIESDNTFDPYVISLADSLTRQIELCIQQGADGKVISNYLRQQKRLTC